MDHHSKWIASFPNHVDILSIHLPLVDAELRDVTNNDCRNYAIRQFGRMMYHYLLFCHGSAEGHDQVASYPRYEKESRWMLRILESFQSDPESFIHKSFTRQLIMRTSNDEFLLNNSGSFVRFGLEKELAQVLCSKMQADVGDQMKCAKLAPLQPDRKPRLIREAMTNGKLPYSLICQMIETMMIKHGKPYLMTRNQIKS